jgi:hydrogenase nickel incorporation protein HypB
MCETCGCGDPTWCRWDQERILSVNDRAAAHNREHFAAHGVLAINLMGSPGSGKTAMLEATARAFAGRFRVAAIAGDLATDRDAERLRNAGIPARAITTGSACHLDGHGPSRPHHASLRTRDCYSSRTL